MYQEGHVNTVANLASMYKFPFVMHKYPTSQASHNDQNTWKTIHHSRNSTGHQTKPHCNLKQTLDQSGAPLNNTRSYRLYPVGHSSDHLTIPCRHPTSWVLPSNLLQGHSTDHPTIFSGHSPSQVTSIQACLSVQLCTFER